MATHIRPHPACLLRKLLASFQLLFGLFPPLPCASDEHTHDVPPRRPSPPGDGAADPEPRQPGAGRGSGDAAARGPPPAGAHCRVGSDSHGSASTRTGGADHAPYGSASARDGDADHGPYGSGGADPHPYGSGGARRRGAGVGRPNASAGGGGCAGHAASKSDSGSGATADGPLYASGGGCGWGDATLMRPPSGSGCGWGDATLTRPPSGGAAGGTASDAHAW